MKWRISATKQELSAMFLGRLRIEIKKSLKIEMEGIDTQVHLLIL